MSTTFFYHSLAALHKHVEFDSSEATHITKALRMKTGEFIDLTNGKGDLFKAEVTIDKHRVSALPLEPIANLDCAVELHLAIAPTKNADRVEWLVEKAIEIGVGEISLIHCRHSERSRISQERLHRVAISALKQSRRTYLPVIKDVIDFENWLPVVTSEQRFIAHCIDQIPRVLLRDTIKPGSSVCIAIGPEGDFSEAEIAQALNTSFQSVSLGSARLRTETAALAAVHTFNLQNQIAL